MYRCFHCFTGRWWVCDDAITHTFHFFSLLFVPGADGRCPVAPSMLWCFAIPPHLLYIYALCVPIYTRQVKYCVYIQTLHNARVCQRRTANSTFHSTKKEKEENPFERYMLFVKSPIFASSLLKLIQDRNKERGRVFLFLPAVGVVVHHLFFTSFSYCIERKNSFFGNQNSLEALVMKTSPTEEQHVIIMDFFFLRGGG